MPVLNRLREEFRLSAAHWITYVATYFVVGAMMNQVGQWLEIARFVFHVQVVTEEQQRPRQNYNTWTNLEDGGGTTRSGGNGQGQPARNPRKLGRNDPCWCGSGKKYKACHYPN